MLINLSHYMSILSGASFLLCACLSFLFIKQADASKSLIKNIFSNSCYLLFISFGIYVYLAISDDFSVEYIANHSNSNLPVFYKISSIWSAHEGSMFVWILFLAIWGYFFNLHKPSNDQIKMTSIGIISLILFGFMVFLLLTSSPFTQILPLAPENGADINPVLQDPALAMHPPTLYLGYVGFVIPFAYSISFLIHEEYSYSWERAIRSWSVIAWSFLTIGIALGSWWAYYELGWGGYWFWDPVENVALMPWLAATAFIHSLKVSADTRAHRSWTILLALLVFSLSLFGAFIVRSGIIDSVHSFANDPERGLYLLAFCSIIVLSSLFIYANKYEKLLSKKSTLVSKQSFISINNILFITLIFSTMLGVLYPLIFEYLYNEKISVGAPFYNSIYIPITIIAAAFLVFSIEINWNGSLSKIKFLHPLSFSIIFAFVITLYLYKEFEIKNILLLISLFVGYLIIIRYLFVLFMSKYINIASFCAHFGLGVLIVAISLNSLLSSERVLNLNINETKTYKGINITLEQIKVINGSNYDSIKGFLKVNDGANQYILEPEKRRYFVRGQITTETDIKVTPIKDIYVTLGDQLDDGSWIVNIQLNYFIRYIWASMIMMALASLFIISNTRRQS